MSSFTRLLVYCMVAITLIFLSFQPKIASAQSSPVWVPTEEDYNSLNSLGWDYVLNAGCGQPLATLDISSPSAYQNSTAQLRADLYTRLGALPTKPAGELLEQKVLVTSSSYQISWVRISSRLEWVPVYGYWAHPINSSGMHPAVIVLHGSGAPPHITLGWRLSGDEPYVNQTSTALSGVTLDLLNAGYSVFIPWLEDDQRWWLPWYELDRWAGMLTSKQGNGNAYSFLVPQAMAGIDFLRNDPKVDPSSIALMGWEQGAQVAAMTAALDERAKAVVWLGPPVDKYHWRQETLTGLNTGAAFEQMDCTWGQTELAALIAPRALLFSYSPADNAYAKYAFTERGSYVAQRVYTATESIYSMLGVSTQISIAVSNNLPTSVITTPLQWLNQQFSYTAQSLSVQYPLPIPENWSYPIADHTKVRDEISYYLVRLGDCKIITETPVITSSASLSLFAEKLRTQVLTDLLGGEQLPYQPVKLLDRKVIMNTPAYTLEWVRFQGRFSGNNGIIGGYLATPIGGPNQKPTVLSMMGYEDMNASFGITNFPYPYLNAYGDYLARQGYIVFMPYIMYPFDGWGAILQARTNHQKNIWQFLLPFYMSSVDFLMEQPNVDTSRIAAYGLSYGGVAALYATAFDPRISELIYSNPPINFSIASTRPDFANAPLWFADNCSTMNLVMSFLIAPRRLVWENGLYDYNTRQNYPTEMRDGLASLYKNVGIERRFEFIQHQGGHETRPWLFTVFYPPPSVNNISLGYSDKVANRQQDAPNVIVIEGSNFLDSPSVRLGQTPLSLISAVSNTITALLPSGLTEGSQITLTVENYDGYLGERSVQLDLSKPTGDLYLLPPNTYFLKNNAVVVHLQATDSGSGIAMMRIGFDPTFANVTWQPYTNTIALQISPNNGVKKIYGQYQDKIGNQSLVYSRTFYLDTLPPTGTLRINGDALDTVATKVKLNLNVIDSGSGISSVSLSNDGLKYSLPFSITSTIEWDLSRGVGTKIVYAKLLDYAGNQATLSDTIQLASVDAQSTGVLINRDALFANSRMVTLTLISPPGTTEMAIQNSVTSTIPALETQAVDEQSWQWIPYQVTHTLMLDDYGPNSPYRSVHVEFRDAAGIMSRTYSDDVVLDELPPTGSIAINDYPPNIFTNTVNLSLNSVDDLSGTDDMQVANNPDFTGAQWQPYTATLSWSVGNSIGPLTIYARYRDRADNLSATYQVTATLPPLDTPIPSIFWQNVVFLQQDAAGVSLIFDMPLLDGVVEVQISSQPTFTDAAWQPLVTILPLSGPFNGGVLYLRFRDQAQHMSESIQLQLPYQLFLPVINR